MLLTEYNFNAHMEATYEEGRMDGKTEGKAEEQLYGIKTLISINKKHCISREDTRRDLMNAYSLDMKAANKYLDLHWEKD